MRSSIPSTFGVRKHAVLWVRAAALAMLGSSMLATAQTEPSVDERPPGARRGLAVARDPGDPGEPAGVEDAAETVRQALKSAMRDAERAIAEAARAGRRVAGAFQRSGVPAVLVVPGAGTTPESVGAMTEDLAVMARILQKVARPEDDERPHFGRWADAGWDRLGQGRDALYLDGMGAIFLLSVDYPLVGPATTSAEKSVAPVNEEWERARREIRGRGRPRGPAGEGPGHPGGSEDGMYQAGRVEALKEGLLEAFRHVTHVKGVREEETVVLVVTGPSARPAGRPERDGPAPGDDVGARGEPGEDKPGAGGNSVLSLRVKKSDVTAWVTGGLEREAFVKRVQISAR